MASESDDLKSPRPSDDAALEAWLRQQPALPALPEREFVRHVLTALPPPRRRSTRVILCSAGFTFGALVAVAGALQAGGGHVDLVALDAMLVRGIDALVEPAGGIALGAILFSVWFAFRDRWRPRWWWPR